MSILSALLNEDILGRPSSDPLLEAQATPVSKREVYISIRRDGVVGDGTRENPYDGSSSDNLDVILNGNLDPTLRSPVRFIFGPGIFRTDGGWKNSTEEVGLWTGIWPG